MKRLMTYVLSIGCLAAPALSAAQTAHTYNIGYESGGNDIVVCEVISGSADVIRKVLKADSSTLSADVVFDLRSNTDAADGIDTITVYAGSVLACDVASGGTLGAFTYNGKKLTIYGAANDDTITGGTGGHNEIVGGSGADDLLLLADGAIDGEDGNDRVRSDFSGGSEDLFGGNGDDCLEQVTEGTAPNQFNCEGGTDRFDEPTGDGDANCETPVSSC
jgi:hypothetical protein